MASFVRAQGLTTSFQVVDGKSETYLRAEFKLGRKWVEVFIYADEAGFYLGNQWRICERQDFDSDDELITAFLEQLSLVHSPP